MDRQEINFIVDGKCKYEIVFYGKQEHIICWFVDQFWSVQSVRHGLVRGHS
jgi:hypothetical protein